MRISRIIITLIVLLFTFQVVSSQNLIASFPNAESLNTFSLYTIGFDVTEYVMEVRSNTAYFYRTDSYAQVYTQSLSSSGTKAIYGIINDMNSNGHPEAIVAESFSAYNDGVFTYSGNVKVIDLHTNQIVFSRTSNSSTFTAFPFIDVNDNWCLVIYSMLGSSGAYVYDLNMAATSTQISQFSNSSPSSFQLSVFPNPSNHLSQISFDLPTAGPITLTIIDAKGREVYTSGEILGNQGKNIYRWNQLNSSGSPLSSGVYVTHIHTSAGEIRSIPLTIIK